ncbi:CPBP family intramembrane glutamic endopeptidase [Bacillus sp. FJAT-22090]|uniref:CPBP family intramembrane glutamic endopeptidase n=1 Tax=Bacillus sp. FJAT-22090 TaxID=1581038 RepID=UPI0006ADCF0E|nr:CPBP family intramembrane glutamic endopeptidase [Bacillus sp. FJAT-22090]
MNRNIPLLGLIITLLLAYTFTWITFSNEKVFWYFYTFTVLFLMSIAFFYAKIDDKIKTIEYILYGVGFGFLMYAIIAGGYKLLEWIPGISTTSVNQFFGNFAPTSIWHFLLLLFIIAPGEEFFWRGYIQQQLKRWMTPSKAILASSVLSSLSFIFSGFWLGMLGAFICGLILGILYEWKKSMPLIILAHIILLVLLFLVFPIV